MPQQSRNIILRANVILGTGKSSLKIDARGLNELRDSMIQLQQAMKKRNLGHASVIGQERLDRTMTSLTTEVRQKIDYRFTMSHQATWNVSWPRLNSRTIEARKYLLNPNSLNDKIEKILGPEVDYEPINFTHKPLDPDFRTPQLPALLRTGSLRRSINVRLIDRKTTSTTSGGKMRITYYKQLQVTAKSAYANLQFLGGMSTLHALAYYKPQPEGSRYKSKRFNIPIPEDYVSDIRRNISYLNELGFQLVSNEYHIPGRNLIEFTKEDVERIEALIELLGEEIASRIFSEVSFDPFADAGLTSSIAQANSQAIKGVSHKTSGSDRYNAETKHIIDNPSRGR